MSSEARDNGQVSPPVQPVALGAMLRTWRERALLTQGQLAARAGLNERTVRRLEADELQRPRSSSLRMLAEALGLDAEELSLLVRMASPTSQRPRSMPVRRVPRQLPADVATFMGRTRELAFVEEAHAAGMVVITAIDGMGGVGKTALAVHWAHQVAERFPDGQLYVNLQGYAPGPPLSPMQVLAVLLGDLGIAADQVPVEVEEAASLYRSLLAGKRMLVLLDNAHNAEQVRPLVPGSPGCMVLVTSRDRLTGLVATLGAHRLTLGVLDPDEAVMLLTHIIGEERVAAEPDALTALAQACGHLPLALRIAAANLTGRPAESIIEYLAELQSANRLDGLTIAQDPQAAVRVAFDHSYHRLTPERRRLYRLLGLIPGSDISVMGAAALADLGMEDTRRALDALADAHLMQPRGRGRYSLHDLLKVYARQRALSHEGQAQCQAAVERLLAWYQHGVDVATGLLFPEVMRLPRPPAAGARPSMTFLDQSESAAWLAAELANLVAATLYAAEHGPHPAAWQLADALRDYFWLRRPMVEWLLVAQAGLDAATVAGDVRAQASGQLSLGLANRAAGRSQLALQHMTTTLTLARQVGWTDCQAAALGCRGIVEFLSGGLRQSADDLAKAVALYRQSGCLGGQADSLVDLGLAERELGLLHEAADHQTHALSLYRQIGSRLGEASVLGALGEIDHDLGHFETARQHLTSALRLHEELGSRFAQAYFLRSLAALERDAGHAKEALAAAQDSLRLAGEIGDPSTEARALVVLAGIHLQFGHAQEADDHYRQALKLAKQIASPTVQAGARLGLADICLALDQPRQALDRAHQALGIAAAVGVRVLQGQAHITLATAHHQLGRHNQALTHARRALELHRQTGHRLGAARALQMQGYALRDSGDPQTATCRWREALELFTRIGSPQATEIHTLLNA
ncbi:ATP-binding protein [Nonomuraea diastatica]|uniref:Helix-turn-helix domain-containing protein n=1 Tax=Nonomuraea diastatica TaxID=1848329 RepID=A0A4R4WCT1_9ACTN|nr:tetratricopeptide repeat protein [Nonomuraea diastatica]TDD16602.1 helix-turn-helix domain-containing protein [Nonomuraea diastatica]